MSADENDPLIDRRKFLTASGTTLLAGLAGCSADETQGPTNNSTPTDPSENQTPINESTGDNKPEDDEKEDKLPVPENVDSEDWRELVNNLESKDDFLSTVMEDDEFTEYGNRASALITNDLPDDFQVTAAEKVGEREQLEETDMWLLQTAVTDPVISNTRGFRNYFSNYGLERSDSSEITRVEAEQMFDPDNPYRQELIDIRNSLIEEGYDQKEVEYIETANNYFEETLNNFYPRAEQAIDENLFDEALQDGTITGQELKEISDIEGNGLITPKDPDPENYSATADPYGTGFVKYVLDLDPEKPTAIFLYETTPKADQDLVDHALDVAEKEYAEAGIQTVWIEGRDDVHTLGDANDLDEIGDRLDDRFQDQMNTLNQLPAHYVLFDEYGDKDDNPPWGVNRPKNSGPMDAAIHTDPYEITVANGDWSREGAVQDTMMAETLDNLYNARLRHRIDHYHRKPPSEIDSEEGRQSWSSFYFADFDRDRKSITDTELEMIRESNLGYQETGNSLQKKLLSQRTEPFESNYISGEEIPGLMD